MHVPKTEGDPTRSAQDATLPPTTINEVTSWWDGSQIYGSDQKTLESLRAFRDGKLTVDERGHLPIGGGGIEQTGFSRDWWVGLSMMHTLFVREHNAICEMLKSHYSQWGDARLFNVARLVNAAVMAKIHTGSMESASRCRRRDRDRRQAANEALIDRMAFNPGNGFEPLGITHVRKVAYATSARNRSALDSGEIVRYFEQAAGTVASRSPRLRG
jgi:hypothetical protein